MADVVERKKRGTDPPRCKNCGISHWGVCSNHSTIGAIAAQAPMAGSRPAKPVTLRGTARLVEPGRAAPTSPPTINEIRESTAALERAFPTPEIAPSPNGKASGFGPDTSGSSPAGATTRRKAKRLKTARQILTEEEKKRRGRPKLHADKKEADKLAARARRAAKKAAAKKVQPAAAE